MFEKIICIEGITCPGKPERNIDFEVEIGKRRSATPHMSELESFVKRGF
jgi:hypothetical protein